MYLSHLWFASLLIESPELTVLTINFLKNPLAFPLYIHFQTTYYNKEIEPTSCIRIVFPYATSYFTLMISPRKPQSFHLSFPNIRQV